MGRPRVRAVAGPAHAGHLVAGEMIIGIDVGSTAVKAGLLGADGDILSGFRADYPTERPQPGWVEQDPDDWVRLTFQAMAKFAATGLAGRIGALGLSSQVNTHVFVDAAGRPLMPAILWQDGRADAEARELDGRITPAQKLAWWGAPMPIDASHPLARMLWVARHRPEVWQRTRWVLLPKDYCIFRLTGKVAADPLSNFGLVDGNLAYVPELLALVPGAADRVATLRAITDVVGEITAAGPLRGAPVVLGTMDAWTGLFGAGGAVEGAAVYLSGTSEILGITSQHVVPTPGIVVFPECAGLRIHAGPTQSGGAAQLWFCQIAGLDPASMSALAARSDRSRAAPIFLPHLQGERAPLWNPNLRGAFLGLDHSTGQADLARAVYEGVGFSARMVLDRLEASAGRRTEALTCGGGGFQSDLWNQIRADILGRSLRRLTVTDPGIVGAVGLAACGIGLFRDLASACHQFARYDVTYEPDPRRHVRYTRLFALYQEAIEANASLNARFAALQTEPIV